MLSPKGVLAVRVPGMPKGREVFLDARGTPRCAHGFTVHELMRQQRAQLRGCATGRTAHEVCGCSLRGLRLEQFGHHHRHWPSVKIAEEARKRKRDAAAPLSTIVNVGNSTQQQARCDALGALHALDVAHAAGATPVAEDEHHFVEAVGVLAERRLACTASRSTPPPVALLALRPRSRPPAT